MASGECSRSSYVQTSVAGDDANVRLTSDSYRVHAAISASDWPDHPASATTVIQTAPALHFSADERAVAAQRLVRRPVPVRPVRELDLFAMVDQCVSK